MTATKEAQIDPPAIDFFALKEKTSPEFVALVVKYLGGWDLVDVSEEWATKTNFIFYVACNAILFVFNFNKENGFVWHQEMYRDAAEKLIKLGGGV
ncbi:MAG: hypothetical protein JWM44_2884 [Bacilli bacterium]|nr:hypothetical protein [Bacilli bacterium]